MVAEKIQNGFSNAKFNTDYWSSSHKFHFLVEQSHPTYACTVRFHEDGTVSTDGKKRDYKCLVKAVRAF